MMTFVPGEDLSAYGIAHSYGLGIERYVTDDITVIGHMGTGQAQGSFFGFDPDHGTAVAAMINTANPGPAALMGAQALAAAANGCAPRSGHAPSQHPIWSPSFSISRRRVTRSAVATFRD